MLVIIDDKVGETDMPPFRKLLVLLVTPSFGMASAVAAPFISAVSGTLANGNSITTTGS